MIWRDDDVGVDTRIAALEAVDDLFQRFRVEHTIAVIAKGIETRPDLLEFIRERRMIVQLHCWTHEDLTATPSALDDLARAVETLERHLTRPTVLYPPWNRSNPEVDAAAAELGLTVSWRKVSLSQYIRCDGGVSQDVVNFHFWYPPEFPQIEQALQIWTRRELARVIADERHA